MIEITESEIISSWKIVDFERPLVSVCCITFNQEKYVRETIDGFISQKTNFPFEILIHDDASTEGTQKIINEYYVRFPNIIHPILQQENQYSKGNKAILASFVYPRAKGKYIAICEGDDYWIDENKLQMQVDFLENHPDYAMCYTKIKILLQEKNKFKLFPLGRNTKSYEDLFLNGSRINTLTSCFRKDLAYEYLNTVHPEDKHWLMGDLPLWLYFTKKSKVKIIPKVTGVYRVLKESASHSSDPEKNRRFSQSSKDIRLFFSNLFEDNKLFSIYDSKCLFNEAVKNKNKKLASLYWKRLPKIAKDRKSIFNYLKLIFFAR